MLKINQLEKRYGKSQVLKKVNLTIHSGTCYGLIGPNGAGKSTLMKIIVGILDDYEGEVLFEDQNLQSFSHKFKTKIGYVPQDIVLNETLSAYDNLLFFGSLYGLKKQELLKQIDNVLELVGLKDKAKETIRTFSGGMKRRINIGCALLHDPAFIIMDEPTVGVDPQSRNYIFDLIFKLKKQGKTILYSSHYMEEIETLCDEISLIDHGEIIEQGTVSRILNKHTTASIYIESDANSTVLESFGELSHRDKGFILEVDHPIATLAELSAFLSKESVTVTRLEIAQRTLEDVFLQLTGRSLRD